MLAIVGGVVLLLAATVAVVVLAGNRPVQSYPPGSPEAALQAYLQAWQSDDLQSTWQSFSTSARAGTSFEEYQRQYLEFGAFGNPGVNPSRRVFIDRTTITGDRAELDLTIEDTWVQGLGANRSRYSQSITMVREDGTWRFDRLFYGLEMAHFGR